MSVLWNSQIRLLINTRASLDETMKLYQIAFVLASVGLCFFYGIISTLISKFFPHACSIFIVFCSDLRNPKLLIDTYFHSFIYTFPENEC